MLRRGLSLPFPISAKVGSFGSLRQIPFFKNTESLSSSLSSFHSNTRNSNKNTLPSPSSLPQRGFHTSCTASHRVGSGFRLGGTQIPSSPFLLPYGSGLGVHLPTSQRSFLSTDSSNSETTEGSLPLGLQKSDQQAEIESISERILEDSVVDTASGSGSILMLPIEVMADGLALIHATGVSYGYIFIGMAIFNRIITFPMTARTMRSGEKMRQIQPALKVLRAKGDQVAAGELMARNGVGAGAMLLPIFVQLPLQIVFFVTIRHLCATSPEMAHEGFLWFKDLAAPGDQFHRLSLISACLFLTNFQLGQLLGTSPAPVPIMRYFMYGMSGVIAVFTNFFPSGLQLFWASTNFSTVIQTVFLSNNSLRKAVGLQKIKKGHEKVEEVLTQEPSQGGVVSPAPSPKKAKKKKKKGRY